MQKRNHKIGNTINTPPPPPSLAMSRNNNATSTRYTTIRYSLSTIQSVVVIGIRKHWKIIVGMLSFIGFPLFCTSHLYWNSSELHNYNIQLRSSGSSDSVTYATGPYSNINSNNNTNNKNSTDTVRMQDRSLSFQQLIARPIIPTITDTKLSITQIPKCLTEDNKKKTNGKGNGHGANTNSGSLPTPVVLMSLGRTGSRFTWQTLLKLTTSTTDVHHNYDTMIPTNKKPTFLNENKQIYNESSSSSEDEQWQWMVEYLCDLRTHPTTKDIAAFVGFFWKAHYQPLQRNKAQQTLRFIAALAATGNNRVHPIRLLRLRRNPIDLILSDYKQKKNIAAVISTNTKNADSADSRKLVPHCRKGFWNPELTELQCVELHYHYGEQLTIDDINRFYKQVYQKWDTDNKVDTMLRELKVPFLSVSYDTLYYPTSIEQCGDGENEWNKALNFVTNNGGRGLLTTDIDVDAIGLDVTGRLKNKNHNNNNSNNQLGTEVVVCNSTNHQNNNINNSSTSNTNDNNHNHNHKKYKYTYNYNYYYQSWQQIQQAMDFVSTTRTRNHTDYISNWVEVEQRFQGTPLAQFLRL